MVVLIDVWGDYMLRQSVQYLKLVGPRRAALLKRLGIETVFDLLYYFPREYDDRSNLRPVHSYGHGEQATVRGTVAGIQELKPRRGLTITKIAIHDGNAVLYAVWFNQPHIKKQLLPGSSLLVTGKVKRGFGAVEVQVTDYELLEEEEKLIHTGRIVPVYSLTDGLSGRLLRGIVNNTLQERAGQIEEFLPPRLLSKYKLPALPQALIDMHFPSSMDKAFRAKKRFIFEELFLLQTYLAARRRRVARRCKSHQYVSGDTLIEQYIASLPFRLTGAQARTWLEIERDMDGRAPMHRLLQGDVGAGKTVVSTLALLKAVGSGYQGALMAPTEILAEQHYLGLRRSLKPLKVEIALLSGGLKKKERAELLERIGKGDVSLVVGTHALIQEEVKFANLAVVVIDEQHRFGVRQRAILQQKGNLPDVLVMTATPIPRTLALTLYGDLEVSVIDELPPGRQPVKTVWLTRGKINQAYNLIKDHVARGQQAYIICPLVEESEKIDLQAAVELFSEISTGVFKECRVGLLHGKMKAMEKEAVMEALRNGKVDVLVSTTVVEVGVDIPNATVMLILDAERFGLAQLHQLRGRVGRGNIPSYCILISEARNPEARSRVNAMVETNDGFVLAEKDLQLRGPGEFTGTRQSGLPEFKAADLVRDWRAMDVARREAVTLLDADPELSSTENQKLKQELKERLSGVRGYLDIG